MPDNVKKMIKGLNDREIEDLYELFFGKILMKKSDFSYKNNLLVYLKKPEFIKSILSKLNSTENRILKILSHIFIAPEKFISEKINVIADDINISTISKIISNLKDKKYIFTRDTTDIVIPRIYFDKARTIDIPVYYLETDNQNELYKSTIVNEINNMLLFLISKEVKISNSNYLYKKDAESFVDIFSSFSQLEEDEYRFVTFFYNKYFLNGNEQPEIKIVKNYFAMPRIEKILLMIKYTFPAFYDVIDHAYTEKKSFKIQKDELESIWKYIFLTSDIDSPPIKADFNACVKFLKKASIITEDQNNFIINYFNDSEKNSNDNICVTTNFYIYMNYDADVDNDFMPAFFSELVKYNKVTEFEINENSIRRAVAHGLKFEDIELFLNEKNLSVAENIIKTLKCWFEKFGSFFTVTGTLFFCNTEDRGKLINSIIESGYVKAQEIKKNEVFLIHDTEVENFFGFLDKSGISYFEKEQLKPVKMPGERSAQYDLTRLIINGDEVIDQIEE